jgi:hypothetical protein
MKRSFQMLTPDQAGDAIDRSVLVADHLRVAGLEIGAELAAAQADAARLEAARLAFRHSRNYEADRERGAAARALAERHRERAEKLAAQARLEAVNLEKVAARRANEEQQEQPSDERPTEDDSPDAKRLVVMVDWRKRPAPGLVVNLLRKGKQIASETTGLDGGCAFALHLPAPMRSKARGTASDYSLVVLDVAGKRLGGVVVNTQTLAEAEPLVRIGLD